MAYSPVLFKHEAMPSPIEACPVFDNKAAEPIETEFEPKFPSAALTACSSRRRRDGRKL